MLLPGLLAALGVGSLVYGFTKTKVPNYQDVLSGKMSTEDYNAQLAAALRKFNPDDKPTPPPPPARDYPSSALQSAQQGAASPPTGTTILPDIQVISDTSHDWANGPTVLGMTVPTSWLAKDGRYGAQPTSLIWLSPDKTLAVIAWNAGTPTAAGINLHELADNQMVLAKVGKNSLTQRVIDWWKQSGAI